MFFWLLILFFLPSGIQASTDNFSTHQQVRFTLNQKGDATVWHQFEIANNYSEIYPKEYSLKLPYTNLTNISASDNYGNILRETKSEKDVTQLFFEFNRPEIGKNKITKFTLSYQQMSLAKPKGNTWEIEIPKTNFAENQTSIEMEFDLPLDFGDISFSSSGDVKPTITGNRQNFKLTNSQSQNKNILLIFGNYQLFDFKLSYILKNDYHQPVKSAIALPPDTFNQQIIFDSITPKPINVTIDPDGNWLADYQIPSLSEIEISVSGQAKIFPPKDTPVQIDQTIYTQSQDFWPVSSPQILAYQFNSAKKVYDFVVAHLDYNYDLISQAERKGAIYALENPKNALCTEFTDLFVTLARANQIPAREIQGFAYTNNPKIKPTNLTGSILHAWPQYYHPQKQIWVNVDPTWEKTTHGIDYFSDLDLNHLTMVIHGQSSHSPQTANKSAKIDFATNQINQTNLPPQISFKNSKLLIINPNNHSLNNLQLSLDNSDWQQKIATIPPFGQHLLTLPKIFFKGTLKISSDNQNYPSIQISNFHSFILPIIIAGSIILIIFRIKK